MPSPRQPETMTEQHWSYIEQLMLNEQIEPDYINRLKFHYKTAFAHGYKHGMEDAKCKTEK